MAKPDLHPRVVALTDEVRLSGVDIDNQRFPKLEGIGNRENHGRHQSIRAVTLEALRLSNERIPGIDVRTESPKDRVTMPVSWVSTPRE